MNSKNILEGKVCIVTGATRGIGLAIANNFASAGATVFINGRNQDQVMRVVNVINNSGGKAYPFLCDISDPLSVRDAFREYAKSFRKLDVLVNNAGVLDDALIGMVSKIQIEQTFSVNTYSVLYMSQYASRLMSRSNAGSIINITSIIGTNGNVGQSVYGGSKAAVIGITKSLAKELSSTNIRVNAIAPGFINTDMARSIPEKMFKERLASIAIGRIGAPEEVANVALFLASELSSYVTGQVIGVDGGMLI